MCSSGDVVNRLLRSRANRFAMRTQTADAESPWAGAGKPCRPGATKISGIVSRRRM